MIITGLHEREPESLLIAAQPPPIMTNYIQAKINTQQNKCWLCGDRDETINHINECIKLAKVYNTRHEWVEEGDSLRIVQEIEI